MALIQNIFALGLFAGISATLVMSLLMILGRYLKVAHFSFSYSLGNALLGFKKKDKFTRPVGFIVHLIVGSLWGIVYTVSADLLRFGTNILSGIIFSLLPWLAMMLVFLPALGAGLFGKKFDKRLKDTMLVYHIFYGFVLGLIASL